MRTIARALGMLSVRLNTAHFALSTWLLANAALLLHIFECRSGAATGNDEILKSSNIFLPQLDFSANCRQQPAYFKLSELCILYNIIFTPLVYLKIFFYVNINWTNEEMQKYTRFF